MLCAISLRAQFYAPALRNQDARLKAGATGQTAAFTLVILPFRSMAAHNCALLESEGRAC
jgi:hypothetical protein